MGATESSAAPQLVRHGASEEQREGSVRRGWFGYQPLQEEASQERWQWPWEQEQVREQEPLLKLSRNQFRRFALDVGACSGAQAARDVVGFQPLVLEALDVFVQAAKYRGVLHRSVPVQELLEPSFSVVRAI